MTTDQSSVVIEGSPTVVAVMEAEVLVVQRVWVVVVVVVVEIMEVLVQVVMN